MNARLTLTAGAATAAASVALHPLISGASWFWGGVGAIIIVGCAAALARLRRLPVVVCFAASVVGLLLYLNAVFSGHRSLIGVIPTRSSLTDLLQLAGQGFVEASRFAPPVPPVRGIMLLAVAGIGAVAVLTDLIAVRLRRTAAAGLPLLALFAMTVATPAPEPRPAQALVFAAGVAGYLVLLAADGRERISAWGRLVTFPVAGRAGRQRAQGPGTRRADVTRSAQSPGTGAGSGRGAAGPGRGPEAAGRAAPDGTRLPDTRSLAAAGRRVGLAAVAVALIVPLLVPGLRVRGLPAGNPGFGFGPGNGVLSPTSLPDPVAAMAAQLRRSHVAPVLSYRTDDPEAPYLRQYVLNLFSDGWKLYFSGRETSASGKLPSAPGLQDAPVRTVHTTIKFADDVSSRGQGQTFIPAPYPPVKVDIGRGWQVDTDTLMVGSLVNPVAGLSYRVTSDEVAASPAKLRQAAAPPDNITGKYLKLPAVYSPYLGTLRALAQRATQGARTAFDKAVAMQQWFTTTGGFSYSLSPNIPDGPAGLVRFLSVAKSGFCQQFAIAMAVLARVLNIPSRVAIGYTAGSSEGGPNYQVSTSDAHSWPELYFQGTGWLRFEPTPAGAAPGQGTATPPEYTLPSPPGSSQNNSSAGPGTLGENNQRAAAGVTGGAAAQHNPEDNPGPSGTTGHPVPRGTPWGLIAALIILAALLAPAAGRPVLRRWRWLAASGDAGRTRAAWLELRDILADFGIPAAQSESPRAVGRRVGGRLPAPARDALSRIALAEERSRYATSPADSRTLRADTVAVRRAIAATASRRARLRARCFPASVLAPVGEAARHALDVFGWIEVGTTWLLGSLIRRVVASRRDLAGPAGHG